MTRAAFAFSESDLLDAEAALCRSSLPDFIERAWHLVEPETKLAWNWHHDELCNLLMDVTEGRLRRVLINIPPGSSKSLIVSTFWPAWEWASNPGLRYLTASYSGHLTIRDNLRVRSIVTSEWYRRLFGLELASDQSAKVRFDTTAKGWRIATSVDGTGTGEHPDRIIIDDPHSAQEARSDVERAKGVDWFDRTISTRTKRNPAIVVIMQRLHEEDLSGHLLARGGWEHVLFPMRFEPDRSDPRDHRTEPGELLWPEGWSAEALTTLELDLGPFGVAGQLQQRPAPEGGGLFKREWFDYVDAVEIPVGCRWIRGWDTAATEGAGDWTVGVKIGEAPDGRIFVADVVRGQWEPDEVDRNIRAAAEMDGKECGIREEKEGGSAGKAVILARAKLLRGYSYEGVGISGDKVVRAAPFRSQCAAGNVYLVRAEWNQAYVSELCAFPVGKNDDQVDGSSCGYNALVDAPPVRRAGTWGRKRR